MSAPAMSQRVVAGLCVLAVFACHRDYITNPMSLIPVASVEVRPETLTMHAGQRAQLHAIARDSTGNALQRRISWESSDEGVALVDSLGLVSAVAEGHVTVSAGTGGLSAEVRARVEALDSSLLPLRDYADGHNLLIGTATSAWILQEDSTYRRIALREFSSFTPEHDMKFSAVHPSPNTWNFDPVDQLIRGALRHSVQVHGHALVWHESIPTWVHDSLISHAATIAILKDHITRLASRYSDVVSSWDVVNEPLEHDTLRRSLWLRALGPAYVDSALAWTSRAAPATRLFINEWGVAQPGPKADAFYSLVRTLLSRGIPLHGVGFELHLSVESPPDFERVENALRRFSNLGLDVAISELDVRIKDPARGEELEQQAEIFRRALSACLSVERCVRFTMWGFTDRYSWVPDHWPGWGSALIFDEEYKPKLSYQSLRRQLQAEPSLR